MVSPDDYILLIPLVCLSLVYWIRDRYMFNRTPVVWWRASTVQWKVLVFLYPTWVFLNWCESLQYRHHIGIALISATGSHIANHISSIAMLNDSFLQTRQQFVSSAFGLLISYVWTTYNHVTFSVVCDENHVETHDCHCDCHAAS
tara:strand:- start:650 stop:1084 length:435 start_codon:yes stop_codon:yes gene_type:complete